MDQQPTDQATGAQAEPLTIAEASRQLRAGALSSVELTRRCLERIARFDAQTLACVTVMGEAALARAAVADSALRATRDRRPLLGIPMGVKDLFMLRGAPTTAGSRVLADWIPDEDAAAVTKLDDAGAIALCKTNTHEFAFGTVTQPTRNPWDLTRIPGGSSGGSAVAVAIGEALGALGSDTGGSIRIPAAACGVTGLKPTAGLVSRYGVIPLSWSLDHVGPLARTVEDCALLLDALVGYDERDPGSVEAPTLDYSAALTTRREPADAVRGTRLGIPDRYFFRHCDAEVEAAVRAAIAVFEALGAELHEVAIPPMIDDLFGVYRAIQKPEAYTYHQEMGWLETRAARYTPAILDAIQGGASYSASEYIQAQRARRAFTDALREAMASVEALVTPTLPVPPRPIADIGTPLLYDGVAEPAGDALRYTFPFNITGQPALSLPCGFTAGGLPIGLQLVAAHFNEPALLRLGHAYERSVAWGKRVPPLLDQ